MTEDILIGTEGAVMTVTLNRPEKLNAITPEMHLALASAFDAYAADAGLRVCVVRGAGRAFCAGSDLTRVRGAPAYPATGYAGIAQRFDLAKPVIAAVHGICMGGGFELALACDMIVASEAATFALPEPRVGVIAVGGGIHRLARTIGVKRAMGPLLTGRRMTAREGFELGFVSEVTAPDALDAAVARTCADILACAPLAVELTKALTLWGLDQPSLEAAMAGQAAHPLWAPWLASEDTQEGPRAFAQKRRPEWTGQ